MAKIKKLKVKGADGNFGEYIALGADAANVDLADGTTVETSINTIKQDITTLNENVSELDTQLGTLNEEMSTMKDSVETLNGTVSTLEEDMTTINEKVNAIDLTPFEESANKVITLSAQSTDEQYPSAKAVYDIIGNVEQLLADLNSGGGVTR